MTSEPPKASIMGWLQRAPDVIAFAVLAGAIGSAWAVHSKLAELERDVHDVQTQVEEIREAVMGRVSRR